MYYNKINRNLALNPKKINFVFLKKYIFAQNYEIDFLKNL